MKVKSKVILLIVALVLLMIFNYFGNMMAFVGSTVYFINFIFSTILVLIWLLYLKLSVKIKSKTLINLYIVFWILEVVYYALYPYATESPFGMIWYLGVIIFLIPMLGVFYPYSLIQDALKIDILYDLKSEMIYFAVFSLIMLVLGLISRQKLR